ncbi:MAG: hypothetical protein L0922_01275 [Candidatus Mariimomonas ferrooxydans]
MNPLDIYKKLPGSKCGDCPAKTCMSFAVKVSKREHSPSECPWLDDKLRMEIDSMLSYAGDWKEKRLAELFQEISPVDFSSIAEDIGAKVQNGLLKIKYIGKEVSVSHSGFKGAPGIWDKLLILMYIKKCRKQSSVREMDCLQGFKERLTKGSRF